MIRFLQFVLCAAIFLAESSSSKAQSNPDIRGPVLLPSMKPIKLIPTGRLGSGARKEVSGIVASRRQPDLFWTIGDAGNAPRIYPIHRNGKLYWGDRSKRGKGLKLDGAVNRDWEDIAIDSDGHVIVGDIGNNEGGYDEFVLYYIEEQEPQVDRVTPTKKLRFRYPAVEELGRTSREVRHDAESLFTIGNTVYVATKHETGRFTELYRLDEHDPENINTLTYVERFDLRDPAVAADASTDGRRLVIATGKSLWLFHIEDSERPLSGPVYWLPFKAPQVESVCFADEKTLLLADEQKALLYEVPIEKLVRVR